MNKIIRIDELMEQSGVKFGTSGARGLVTDMTDLVCYAYTVSFLQTLEQTEQTYGTGHIGIGGDLRSSTDRIMIAVAAAASDKGYDIINCGKLPSPALALYGIANQIPTIMVTGSHIPEDRNGIKYTKADGEILKSDEARIRSQTIELPEKIFNDHGMFAKAPKIQIFDSAAIQMYIDRYTSILGSEALGGFRIGVYQHSAVGRDIVVTILNALGAETSELGREDTFVPVDTEAIRQVDIEKIAAWSAQYKFDAIVSTDGDSDRPLISDEKGVLFRGDVAGILCAKFLGADAVVTPVTSNTAVEKCGYFNQVLRTRVGSPYVIEGMQSMMSEGNAHVCGYEANGGFLTATDIEIGGRSLRALPTRDAIIVLISLLMLSKQNNSKLSHLESMLPARYTYSDRLQNFPTSISLGKVKAFDANSERKRIERVDSVFGKYFGPARSVNHLDGCRITFQSGNILHLRPSGNAPEFRCYTESDDSTTARSMAVQAMEIMRSWI